MSSAGEEGFALQTLMHGADKCLVIAGRTPKGVFHGAIYARDFLLDITQPDKQAVVREVPCLDGGVRDARAVADDATLPELVERARDTLFA